MSKPNLVCYSSSVGIFNNDRLLKFRSLLRQRIKAKIDFAELYVSLFEQVMAYAAIQQIDGNLSGLEDEQWELLFRNQNLPSPYEKKWKQIKQAMEEAGLLEDAKIRGWPRYNRHLAEYEKLVANKRYASKMAAKKRQKEAKDALKNGSKTVENGDENHQKNDEKTASETSSENGSPSPSKQLWLIEKALELAKGPARKDLLAKKKALLERETDSDLSTPPPERSPQPISKPHKSSPGEFQRTLLKSGRTLIAEGSPELLTEGMVRALVNAGEDLPGEVKSRFRKLLEQHEKEAGNPVPG